MTHRRDTVAIPIETTARELLPKLYLAIRLADAGFTSYIGMKSLVSDVAVKSGHAIYLDKGYHSGVSEKQYAKLREAGCLIVDLDEENGVDFRDFHMLNVRMPDSLFGQVDQVLVWGEAQYVHLSKNRPSFDAAKVSVTGHPRFDLLKPKYRGLYAQKAEQLAQQYGPFILLNTNTKYGNNMNGRDFIIQNYGTRVKGLMERLEYDDRRLESNVSLARRLAEETPFNVVLRPHPEEDISVYHEIFAEHPKVFPIYDDTPIYWLLAADFVIHNHSTTGLESAMLGKTPISFSPLQVDEGFIPWIPVACSLQMTDESEVVDFALRRPEERPEAPDISDILESFFSYERESAGLVVDAIRRLAESKPAERPHRSLGGHHRRLQAKSLLQKLKGGVTMSDLARNKLRDLQPPIVKARFEALLREMPVTRGVELKTLHPLLFKIAARQR